MLTVAIVSAIIAAPLLAYGLPPRRPLLWALLAGSLLALGAMLWLRAPREDWAGRSFDRGLLSPVPIAIAASLVALAIVACVPSFRRSAPFPRARLAAWALALAMGGAVAGVAQQMRDYEITRWRSQLVRQGLEAHYTAHGRYPARLEDLVPAQLEEVPRARMGWRSVPFEYAVRDGGYRLAFRSGNGTWVYDSATQEWWPATALTYSGTTRR